MSELSLGRELITTQELLHRDLGRLSIEERNGLGERNRFVKKFEWIPHWQAEVTVALRGLPIQLKIIDGMPEPYAPARGVYYDVLKYWSEAGLSVSQLDEAVAVEGEHVPSVDGIRQNFAVRGAMAKYNLAHYHFDNFSWHPKKRDKLLRIPNRMTDARLVTTAQDLVDASDDKLYANWFLARISEQKRFNYWDRELRKVQSNPLVLEIQGRNRNRER